MTLTLQRESIPADRIRSHWSDQNIPQPKIVALVLVAQLVGAMTDFGSVGLAPADGIDLVKWIFLLPGVALTLFLLFTSKELLAGLSSGPTALFLMWLLWALLGVTWSLDPRSTLIQMISAGALFILPFWYTNKAGADSMARAFCWAAILVVSTGLLVDLGPFDLKVEEFERFPGTEPGANRFSGISAGHNQLSMLGGITLAVLTAINPRIRGGRFLQVVSLIAAVTAIVLSGSRTVILGVLVALLLAAGWKTSRRRRALAVAYGLSASLIGVGLLGLFGITTTFQTNRSSLDSLNGRDAVWEYARDLALESPVNGLGMMATNLSWEQAYLEGQTSFSAFDAHNMMLEVVIGTGFIGLALFMSSVLWTMARAMRATKSAAVPMLALILVASATEALISAPTVIYCSLGVCMALVHGKKVWTPYD